MTAIDHEPAGRILHVCADPSAGAAIEQAARRAGFTYSRFTNAFSVALELLTRPPAEGSPAVLLLAADTLAKVELPIVAWASGRWPELPIWAHGSLARFNGQAANARLRLVQPDRVEELLVEYQARRAATGLARPAEAAPPAENAPSAEAASPAPAQQVEAAPDIFSPEDRPAPGEQGLTLEPPASQPAHEPAGQVVAPEPPELPELPHQPPVATAAESDESQAAEPVLKLHAEAAADGPLVTDDELAALLGPQEDGHVGR